QPAGGVAVGGDHPELVAPGDDGRGQGALRRHRRLLPDRFHRGPQEDHGAGPGHARRRRPDRALRGLRAAVREARAERDAEDVPGLPARHADHPGRDDQRRPAGLHPVLTGAPLRAQAVRPWRARVSARRRASGIRWRPAICRTSSAAPRREIPAAVTYSGRAEVPRSTGMAWVAVRKAVLATPITGTPNSAWAWAPRPGRLSGSRSA